METIIYKECSVKCTCGGCHIIYEFEDAKGIEYYFRLRHGYWYLSNETNDTEICSGKSDSLDGVCSWDDVINLVGKNVLVDAKEVNKIDLFLKDLFELYDKYDLSISHEDFQGGFIIEKCDEYNKRWMKQYLDNTESKDM